MYIGGEHTSATFLGVLLLNANPTIFQAAVFRATFFNSRLCSSDNGSKPVERTPHRPTNASKDYTTGIGESGYVCLYFFLLLEGPLDISFSPCAPAHEPHEYFLARSPEDPHSQWAYQPFTGKAGNRAIGSTLGEADASCPPWPPP